VGDPLTGVDELVDQALADPDVVYVLALAAIAVLGLIAWFCAAPAYVEHRNRRRPVVPVRYEAPLPRPRRRGLETPGLQTLLLLQRLSVERAAEQLATLDRVNR
jgi:hypothetical protein